jgi:hypothetical protein
VNGADQADTPQEYVGAEYVAARLSVGRTSAYEIMKRMRHVRLGKSVRVAIVDFEAWLREQAHEPERPLRLSRPAAPARGVVKRPPGLPFTNPRRSRSRPKCNAEIEQGNGT